ncbi:MAG TPA: nitronate monooxygenase [Solimonas sp.]|nr:nitronate monooxygenase [Solimonas sp.]
MTAAFRQLLAPLLMPVMQAPMFLVSGTAMVIAAGRAGILGSFPTQNARTPEVLDDWLHQITDALGRTPGIALPWAANLIVHPSYTRRDSDLALLERWRAPLIITALGSPAPVVARAHSWGGLVFADVTTPALARKALRAGVDGLVLVCAGAGGHTGQLSPFAFVDAVRQFWDGPLILGGGIGSGAGIRAVQALGVDLAYLGTRFLATRESLAVDDYKQMLVAAGIGDIVCSDAITGVPANWLRASLQRAGHDPDHMPSAATIDVSAGLEAKRWRDIWSAGQAVCTVPHIETLAEAVDMLYAQWLPQQPAHETNANAARAAA